MQKCVLRCVAVMVSVRVLKVLKNGILGKMGAEVFDFRDKNEYLCSPIISKISVFCLTVIAFGRAEREA